MSVNYRPLFTIQIAHDYYVDRRAKGLALMPSPSTQRLMKAHRMLFRNMPYGAVVLYRTEGAGSPTPFISLPVEMAFTFAMYAENPGQFFTITAVNNPGALIYFENDPADTNVDAEEAIPAAWLNGLEAPLFTASFTDPNSVLEFSVLDRKDEAVAFIRDVGTDEYLKAVQIEPVDAGARRFEQQVNLFHPREGRYRLQTNGDFAQNLYISKELAAENLIAVAEIILNNPGDAVSGKRFSLQFERRAVQWKYRIVNKTKKNDFRSNPPAIALGATANTPLVYGTPAFGAAVQVLDAEDKVQGLETWEIVSTGPIPFYELPLRNLELSSGTNMLSENLPGASSTATLKWDAAAARYESEIYVFV